MVRHAADAHKLTADRASWRNEFAYIKEKCGSELAVRPNLEIADVREDIAHPTQSLSSGFFPDLRFPCGLGTNTMGRWG